jgi:hypothetical protein
MARDVGQRVRQTSGLTGGRRARRRHGFWHLSMASISASIAAFAILALSTTSAPTLANGGLRHVAAAHQLAPRPGHLAVARDEKRPLVEIATTRSATSSNALFGRTSVDAAWVLLGFGLALILSINIFMIGHLRRTYARPAAQPKRRKLQRYSA